MYEGEDYWEQFKDMKPYLEINEEQWEHIKGAYPKDVVKERLAEIAMTYPIPYADITEEDAYNDFMKLKGIRWNEILKEGEELKKSKLLKIDGAKNAIKNLAQKKLELGF